MQIDQILTLAISCGSVIGTCVWTVATTKAALNAQSKQIERLIKQADDLDDRVTNHGEAIAVLKSQRK